MDIVLLHTSWGMGAYFPQKMLKIEHFEIKLINCNLKYPMLQDIDIVVKHFLGIFRGMLQLIFLNCTFQHILIKI